MTTQLSSAAATTITDDKRFFRIIAILWVLVQIGLYSFWPGYRGAVNSLALLALTHLPLPSALDRFVVKEVQTLGLPLGGDTQAYWFVARAGGVLAYLLLWLATLWGILMSSKMVKGVVDATIVYGLHEFLPLLAISFTVIHAFVLLFDRYINFGLAEILLPFASHYERFWTGLGTVAFYLLIAFTVSFYVRQQIGQKTWRTLHYASYLTFVLALVHGLLVGSDSQLMGIRAMYVLTGATLLFATIYRVLMVQSPTKPAKPQAKAVSLTHS